MKYNFKLGVIGYGNMAEAIIERAKETGVCLLNQIYIFDTNADKIILAEKKGFKTAKSIADITLNCKYILLSVKPQSAKEVFTQAAQNFNGNIFISIMAGITVKSIKNLLKNVKVCRCMPNTPALKGKGITAIDSTELNETEKEFVFNLFNSVGETLDITENYMNAVTAVSGSGPAYVYLFIKAFTDAAVNLNLSQQQAKTLVLATINGAAQMVKDSDENIDTLIDRVCSKGGTTIEGIKALKSNGFEDTVKACVNAAFLRAEELSKL